MFEPTLVSPELELDRNDKRPLHQQLLEHYRGLIEQGALTTGERLPTEMALMARHGVSRGTVRQALRGLSDAGLIRRETKNGTVVLDAPARTRQEVSRQKVSKQKISRQKISKQKISRQKVSPQKPLGQIVGVVFPETRDAFCLDIMKGVQAACREAGAHAAFGYSHHSSALEHAEVTRMKRAGFGGVLILPHDDASLFRELAAARYPFVYLDQAHAEVPGDFVGVDNVAASFGATAHLLGLGHTSVAFVCQNAELAEAPSTVRERFAGYRDALNAHGLTFDPSWLVTVRGAADYAEFVSTGVGRSGLPAERLPAERSPADRLRPRAAVCANDATAAKLLDAAAGAGVRVPQDLAVVGFDDIPAAEALSLTTVAQPSQEIGLQAARLLLSRIGGDVGPLQRRLLPTRLVVRGSCGA